MTAVNATATIRTLTMGIGTNMPIDEPGIEGLGVPDPKVAESVLDGRDGSIGGPEFSGPRALSWTVLINGTDQDDAMNGLADLNVAFASATDGVDVQLDLDLPGGGAVSYLGRPRGVVPDLTEVGEGFIKALVQFVALNPNPT